MRPLLNTVCILCMSIPFLYGQSSEITILKHKGKIQIEALTMLNSGYRETNLSISPDGKYLFYMSDRGGMPWSQTGYGSYKGKSRYDGDIWYAQKSNGKWLSPKALGRNVNTSSGEDEPNISPDGQSVVYQSWVGNWRGRGGPYYEATLRNNSWSRPVALGSGINRFFRERASAFGGRLATDGVAVSPDRNTFIVAFGPDYDGNMDLYRSTRQKGVWSVMKKLAISTPKDERSAFLAGDGKTLFFASNGYKGLGGLDIYKTTLNPDGSHGPIVNLGAPFNTPKDDYGFIITASGEEAYFVREGNIYYANLKAVDIDFKPSPTMIISGKINTQSPITDDVVLDLQDPISGTSLAQSKLSFSGTYSFAIPEMKGLVQIRSTPSSSYLVDTTFAVAPTGTYQEVSMPPLTYTIVKKTAISEGASRGKKARPAPIKKTGHFDLDIHFDFDKTALAPAFQRQLDDLYASLKSKDFFLIKIIGHTDDKGNDAYNVHLGLRRAREVRRYLQGLGVPPDWMFVETHGEHRPIARNETETGAYKNRRAEVLVVYEGGR